MNVDVIFAISFLATIGLLAFSVIYINYLRKKDREFESKRRQVYTNYQEILNRAHSRAKEVLETSAQKAEKLLLDANYINQNINQEIDKDLKEVEKNSIQSLDSNSHQMLDEYKQSVHQLKDQFLKEEEEVVKQMNVSMEQGFKEFKAILEKSTLESQANLGKNISAEFDKVKSEIEQYKAEQIKKIDQQVIKVISKLSGELLGKEITPQDHEKLVMQALEQAKKEGMFN